jgi:propanol-preferring alcohol dehydrogenase
MDVPDMQYAAVAEVDGGPIQYKQIPVPKPVPDQVLVNIEYSGSATPIGT